MPARSWPRSPLATCTGVLVIVLALTGCASTPPGPGSAAVVTVDALRSTGRAATELNTQIIYPGVLDRVPGGPALLADYAAPKIRLMLGTDGAYLPDHPPTLPAGWTKGAWDFRTIDELVTATFAAGARPVLNIGYMPDWMWNCATAQPVDATFAPFGEYAARLVSYYNRGSFIAEDGRVITNPAGTAHRVDTWEIWNEPDLWTLACVGPTGKGPGLPSLSPATYVAVWNALAPRMRAVDPTIKLAGPTTARGVEGNAYAYLDLLMRSGDPKPDIATLHGYGSHDERDLDRCLFDGYASGSGCLADGIPSLTKMLTRIQTSAPGRPTWVTEANALASYGIDAKARNWGPLGAAWRASAFARLSAMGVDAIFDYSFVHPGGDQFSAVDPTTGTRLLPYWTNRELARAFPVGATIVASGTDRRGIDTLAVRLAGGAINVLIVNRIVASASDVGGAGQGLTIELQLAGVTSAGELSVRSLDAGTPLDSGPVTRKVGAGTSVTLALGGYSATIVSYEPAVARAPSEATR